MAGKFIVIDGSSLMYRAFYALPLLTDRGGHYTNAVYGFVKMFLKIMEELKPETVAIAFDKGKKTFRNDLFTAYKGTRKATPPELLEQIPLLHELAVIMGVEFIEKAGFEADDIIGTLAVKAARAGNETIVVTGDRDALQLVRENIKVLLTKKGITELEIYDEAHFKERYGLLPQQLIDLKGLMGDTSDNIPGVPGVGEKTAIRLLTQFDSLENVLENASHVSGKKLMESLLKNAEQALLSKKLATILTDMPLEYDTDKFKLRPDIEALRAFCRKYSFRSVFSQIETVFGGEKGNVKGKSLFDAFGEAEEAEQETPEAEELLTESAAAELAGRLRESGSCVFYPVYEGAAPYIVLAGLYIVDAERVFYAEKNTPAFQTLLKLFCDERLEKVTHDFKTLYKAGISVAGGIFDTMLAAYILEPASNRYVLNELIDDYKYDFPYAYSESGLSGGCAALAVGALYPVLKAKLSENGLTGLYERFELPLVEVLASMEQAGICVDRGALHRMSVEYGEKTASLLAEVHALAGEEFNVNSTKQLGRILFEKLGLPVVKKTKNGYSTAAEVLEKLYDTHPIVPKILEYRTAMKLKSTYLDGIDLLLCDDSRIYARFNQTATATGRLSSSEPNLQNIPVRTEEGRKIRELFVPGEGFDLLVSADYSQIELRILAHMSQDKNFIEAFRHNEDIHARTAAEVFGVPLEEVSGELRSRAKAVNFGIVYGISDYGLAKDLCVPRKVAAQYIESYFEKCPNVKSYIDGIVAAAHRDGFVTTLFGRRRYLPDINNRNFTTRSFAERMAMNTPIQGTAADIIKKAMIDVHRELKRRGLKSRILVQVHDELLLEVTQEELGTVEEILKGAMQNTVELTVPLTIDIHSGKCWAEAK